MSRHEGVHGGEGAARFQDAAHRSA